MGAFCVCGVYGRGSRGIRAEQIQCDEIWSFCYAEQGILETDKSPPKDAGNLWTWTAIDNDSKMILSWLVSKDRGADAADHFAHDLRSRVVGRSHLVTDGLWSYVQAIKNAFEGNVNYAQLVKTFGKTNQNNSQTYTGQGRKYSPPEGVTGMQKYAVIMAPKEELVNTSYVERQNLTMRMSMRRYTRLTNGFSEKALNHHHMTALYTVYYNFCRSHSSLGNITTPAMAAGVAREPYGFEWLVGLADSLEWRRIFHRMQINVV